MFPRFVLWFITLSEKRKMVSAIRLLIFFAIFNVAESTSGSSRVVYVSIVRGKALPWCGSSVEPCKTLKQGLDRVAWKGKVYIEGQGTEKNPYTCELESSSSKALTIKKSFTLLSYNSTARISCSNGIEIENPDKSLTRKVTVNLTKVVFVDSKRLWVKDGINITLNGVLFKNTTLRLRNAWSVIKNCNFRNSYPAICVYISNTLPFYKLQVQNTLFQENCGCIEINQPRKAKGCNRKIVVKLQDILFRENTILMTKKPKGKESGLVYFRGSKNCNCKPNMSFTSKWKNVTVIDNQGQVKLCNKTSKEKQKDCCWRRKDSPDGFTRNIFAAHACKIDLSFLKVKSLNNVNTRFLMSQSSYNTIQIRKSSYDGHRIDDKGGVILVKSSSSKGTSRVILDIDDSTFFNNSGTLGGVLQIEGGTSRKVKLNMFNVSFLYSYGSDFGCVVSVAKVNYDRKSSLTHAASIVAYFKRVLVNDTRFSYKQTSKERHYAAFCFSASYLSRISVTESSFCKNDVPALVLRHGSTHPSVAGTAGIKLVKTDFIENYSPHRENAVVTLMVNPHSAKMSSLNFSRTTFMKNNGTAVLAKYVIYVRAINLNCIQNIGHCMLIESNLRQWPRGISSLNSNLTIEQSVFSQNLKTPIRFINAKPRFLLIQILDTSFHENRAALRIEVGHKQNNTLISGKLDIKHTNFTSNSVYHGNILSVILMVPTTAKFRTRISKTVFRNNVQNSKGYDPDISSLFFFYMPDDFEVPKNRKCRKFPDFNYTLRQRSFREVVFENNTGVSSMLYISNGFNSFYRCIFKNSFAKYPRSGAHVFIEEGTARVMFRNTKFEQTKISNCKPCNDNPCKHSSVLPFVNTGARGHLIVINSSFTLHASERKTKMFIIENGRYVSFDSRTQLRCPIGSYINFENSSHVILPKFTLDHCRLNITRIRFVCRMCPVSTYSLQRGSFNGLLSNKTYVDCFTCPYGGKCVWNIKSKTDFWGYISSQDPPQLNFTRCPEHYCRVPKQTANTSVYNRCTGNRTGLMCGECKEGFTESLFNHECRPVHECRDGWFWAIAVLYSVVMGVYILLRPPIVTQLVKKIMWFRHNEMASMPNGMNEQTAETSADSHGGHGFSKIIFYFYQVADLLMLESSTQILKKEIFLVTLISFYNFEVDVADSSFGCPFPGLTAVTKELFRSSQVFAVMVFLLVLYFLHWLLWVIRKRPRPHFAPYLAAIIEVLLLGYERLGHTSFNLLQCTALNMNGQKVWKMFIDGNITCWVHWWQFAMIAYNIVFVIPFMLVLLVGTSKLQRGQIGPFQFLAACFAPLPFLVYWLLKIKRTTDNHPSDATGIAPYQRYREHFLEVIQGPFRPPKNQSKGTLYWESILIGRRLVLLCLHSLVPTPMLRILSMTICCLLILLQDVVVMPFKERKMNALAAFLLCIHVVLGAINLAKATLINAAVTPRGPPKTQMHGLQRVELILLGILPFVFILLVVTCLVSQAIRLIIKASLYIFNICFQGRSRGRNTSLEGSFQPLLDPTII